MDHTTNILTIRRNNRPVKGPSPSRRGWVKAVLTMALLLLTTSAFSQSLLKGIVIDKETGDSIPFSSLIYKGNHVSVAAGADGRFEIERHNGWTLTVKAVGYKSQTVAIKGDTPAFLTVSLKSEAKKLDEVVVKSKRKSKYSRKDNPAVELMKRVVAAKKRTDLENYDYYQYQKYQKITAKRDFALLSLFLGTGIRVSECVGMNLTDVDFENNAFVVTRKGGNQVVLYFSPEVADALADYMEERKNVETLPGHEDALFLSLQRKRITQRAVQNLVKKYAAYAAPLKPKISPHKLRSTYATNLYNETGDIYLVADVLGHSSVDTTRRHYADMTDARRRMAAEHVHLPGDPDFKPD